MGVSEREARWFLATFAANFPHHFCRTADADSLEASLYTVGVGCIDDILPFLLSFMSDSFSKMLNVKPRPTYFLTVQYCSIRLHQ